jgi:hypothetical protein
MFTFFVFQRFGLAIPITLMIVGVICQRWYDSTQGPGYYSSHLAPMGLTLFVTGLINAVISLLVTVDSSHFAGSSVTSSSGSGTSGKYSSLLIESGGDGAGTNLEQLKTNLRNKVENFVHESSGDDSFCYVPLNRCSQVLMAVGIVVMVVGAFQ